MLAGDVSGALFPTFARLPLDARLFDLHLASAADMAKLMMWSIVAGFSERLIPDFLSSLGKNVSQRSSSAPSPPTVAE
jgi:hypothetical protein